MLSASVSGIVGKTQSSAHSDNTAIYGPNFGMDGIANAINNQGLIAAYTSITKSDEIHPWWQVEFENPIEVRLTDGAGVAIYTTCIFTRWGWCSWQTTQSRTIGTTTDFMSAMSALSRDRCHLQTPSAGQ